MFLISKIIRFFKKPVPATYKPTEEDINLLLYIKENIGKGIPVIINPPTVRQIIDAMSYENAKEMIKVGMSQQEVLEKTGFWIKDAK